MMSEAEDQRPLTRRERRIKEFGETGAIPLLNADGSSIISNPPADEEFLDISPLDENGNPRSRREIREIREQQRTARAAAQQRAEAAQTEAPTAVEAPTDSVVAEDATPTEASGDAARVSETPTELVTDDVVGVDAQTIVTTPSFDDLVLLDEEDVTERTFVEVKELREEAGDGSETAVVSVEAADVIETVETVKVVDAVEEANEVSSETMQIDSAEAGPKAKTKAKAKSKAKGKARAQAETEVAVAVPAEEIVADVELEAVEQVEPEPVQAKRSSYTFPDITPLEDEVSVFDDPAVRTISGASQASPAFDDIISRAVAQEGASGSTNTSALILPSMPDTGGLSGPLGETGELFITGSIDLPRSFSETGGHASLIDSVDADPHEEFGAADQDPRDSGIAPVSATRAVSARVIPGPVVTEAQKEKSKLPVVFIATGGGLVVVVAGLLIWGATSGMFG